MKTRRLYVWHLLSSSLFAIGTVVPVVTYAICYHKGDDQNRVGFRVMEGCSWTALAGHILPEMVIDLNTFPKSARSHPHMRYGTKPFANFLQSILFAAACVFQGSYYCHVWSSDDSEESMKSYQVINLIAGHVWLCSGLVTYVSGRWEGFQYDFSEPLHTILDQVANDTYTVTTVLLCLAGYVMLVSAAVGSLLHALVRAIWAIVGSYHFTTDLQKIYSYISTRMESDGVDSPLTGGSSHHHHQPNSSTVVAVTQRRLSPSRRDSSRTRYSSRSSSPTKESHRRTYSPRSRHGSPTKERATYSSSSHRRSSTSPTKERTRRRSKSRDRLSRHNSGDRKKKKSSSASPSSLEGSNNAAGVPFDDLP